MLENNKLQIAYGNIPYRKRRHRIPYLNFKVIIDKTRNLNKKKLKHALDYVFKDNDVDINAIVNYGINYDNTTLTNTPMKGHFDVVKYSVENWADINARDIYGKTALIIASENEYFDAQ